MRPAALAPVLLLAALPALASCGSSSASGAGSSSAPATSTPASASASASASGRCPRLSSDLAKLDGALTGATSNSQVVAKLNALKPTLTADVASGSTEQKKAVADLNGVIDTISQAAARNASSAPAGLQTRLQAVQSELAAACG